MARPWIKVSTDMVRDPDIMALSSDAFKLWTVCLLEAGRTNDHGRVGKPKHVAWVLQWQLERVVAAVDEVNGRLEERDGQLHVRDWYQWQPKRVDERPNASYRS